MKDNSRTISETGREAITILTVMSMRDPGTMIAGQERTEAALSSKMVALWMPDLSLIRPMVMLSSRTKKETYTSLKPRRRTYERSKSIWVLSKMGACTAWAESTSLMVTFSKATSKMDEPVEKVISSMSGVYQGTTERNTKKRLMKATSKRANAKVLVL